MSDKSQKPAKPNDHIEEKATEKEALDASVAENSQTDAKGKAEIDKEITNASSGSLGFDEGITAIRFEIDDDEKTVASKDVRSEQSDTDDSENDSKSITLTGVLKAIKDEGGYEQKNRADGGITLKAGISKEPDNSWQSLGKRLSELPIDQRFKILATGLRAGIDQYQHEEHERAWGNLIGTVQGVGEVATNLAKVADFSAALILGDKERANRAGAEFGEALGL